MAFNYLPNEIKEKILLYASEYSPALKMVSKLWREIISYSGFNKRISFKDLVRRGDVDLLIDLHKRNKKDDNCSLLIYAAFYGREELCHLAKRWGESNFEGMLYAATKGGHKNICQIARAWGAKGIDNSYADCLVKASCESNHLLQRIFLSTSYFKKNTVMMKTIRDLRSIVKEWELDGKILKFSMENNSKTGNVYMNINRPMRGRGWRNWMQDPKPKDLWSYGGVIIALYCNF